MCKRGRESLDRHSMITSSSRAATWTLLCLVPEAMSTLARISLVLPLIVLVACATEAEPVTVSEWLGAEPHGEMHGEADGERVDVVADAEGVTCKREYEVPDPNDSATWTQGRLKELEVSFLVVIDGVERRYELELYNHDFSSSPVGSALAVVPVVTEGAAIAADAVHVEVQWEWEDGNQMVAFEQIATGGTVELHELSGSVGSDGLVIPAGEGSFGAFIELELPDGALAASFTAPCTLVEVEMVE